MADFTITMKPLFANLNTRQFADRVFYLRANDQGEFFVEEHSAGPSNNQVTKIGKLSKGIIADKYIDHLKKNGVQILNHQTAKQEITDAIDSICSQNHIPLI